MPERSLLEMARQELEKAGLQHTQAAQPLYGWLADVAPSQAAYMAFSIAKLAPMANALQLHLAIQIIKPETLGNILINAACREDVWLMEHVWERAPLKDRVVALSEASKAWKQKSAVWLLHQGGFPQQELLQSLTEGLVLNSQTWVKAALAWVEKPWKCVPELRKRAPHSIGFLDEQWAAQLSAHPAQRPSARFLSVRMREELPLVSRVLREATLEQQLPVPQSTRPKPRF